MSRHIVQIAVVRSVHERVAPGEQAISGSLGRTMIPVEVETLYALDNNGMVWRLNVSDRVEKWELSPELPNEKEVPTRLRSQEIGE